MTIDVLGIRDQTLANVAEVYANITLLEGACVFLGAVALFGAFEWHRRWTKGKGLRMAVEHERQRIKQLLSDGLTDLILKWETDGSISRQQGDQLYKDLSKNNDLPDLIPRQRRTKIIKTEIKTRLKSPKHKVTPNIPGDKPPRKMKFRETVGKVSKFFKSAQA